MSQYKYRFGFVVAVIAMATLACTCGGLSALGQAQSQLKTAEALATGVATSGVISTAEALATGIATSDAGGGAGGGANLGAPDNIPVFDGAKDLVAAGGAVQYTVTSDLKTVEDFYKKGMADKGWKEDQPAVELAGVNATLTYVNDTQKAAVVITATGSDVAVQIAVTNK